ncbi:hypothetical protein IWQ60_003812 [Tieghemiomyces parasiticus]|uniref:Glutamine amidotransferase domain-containing protein n=1 Tax=Tieghemiomyces parasiticus TaxID=78921 RepID=A0A9W8DZW3_9FUNG|nr:hypothetical protein IWQ60_003812 [Tieghemiomyces parasiticus]
MTALRVALLVCDIPGPEIRDNHGDYVAMFTKCLTDAGQQLEPPTTIDLTAFTVFDTEGAGPITYPSDPTAFDVVVITGSKSNAYDGLPWINRLVEYVGATITQYPRLKWLGICFGHQVIARALGAKVILNPKGWELGNYDVTLTEEGRRVLDPTRHAMKIIMVHRDIVVGCPEGFTVLGSTPICSNQGMVKGDQVLTIQGHPEYTNDAVSAVSKVRYDNGRIPREVYDHCQSTVADNNDSLWFNIKMVQFARGDLLAP